MLEPKQQATKVGCEALPHRRHLHKDRQSMIWLSVSTCKRLSRAIAALEAKQKKEK
jgi:hypothetical protein